MKENWKDQAFVTYMTANWNKHPNGSEERLGEVLEKYFPGIFKFVGNSSEAYIGGRLTDFIDRVDKKIAIEMFGLRWHDCSLHPKRPSKEELTAHYASYGFKCLVFWEDVVWCDEDLIVEVVDRLLECGRLADFEDPTVTLKSRVWRLTHNAAYNKKRREKRRQVRKYLRLHPEIVAEYEARLQLEAQD
jgi:very-short-patch-repair endonuclease